MGAFVPVDLKNKERHQSGVDSALKVAHLMYEAGFKNALIVLADDNGKDPQRSQNAGRISSEMELDEQQWRNFADGVNQIAKAVDQTFGIKTVFHHHCGGFIETPKEIDRLMELTDPELIGLCLDTGHYAFGGGNPETALKKYADRLWHVHFKDFDHLISRPVVYSNRGFGMSPMDQGLRVVGTVEFGGLQNALSKSRIKNLILNAKDMLDGLPEHKDEWLGFRPTLPDFLPIIGPSKNYKNVFYSFGHHHLGWTLGAISGKIVSGMIANENTNMDLKPYSSVRFA